MISEKTSKKNVATPKQTSGGGYTFENMVVAYYLTWMLFGHLPFSKAHGSISRIDCQVQVDEWLLFDDLLLTLQHGEQQHRYALSIKSNIQFTKTSAPKDFVESAWSLFLHEGSEVFIPETDVMGLICEIHPNPPKSAIQSLLRKAHDQTPEKLASRIKEPGYASGIERNLFGSFSCPDRIEEKHGSENTSTGNILKRIIVKEFDFETTESDDKARAVSIGSDLLLDGSVENGIRFWNELNQIAQRLRISGGGISREELWTELKNQFEFRDLPDFSSDWYRLTSWYINELKAIPDNLGGKVQIERQDQVDEVLLNLNIKSFTAIIGPSGVGKSVIGKWSAREFSKHANVLWFKGQRFRSGYIETFASHHGLTHPFSEVLSNIRYANGLVVIDSTERLLDEDDFKEAAQLLHQLKLNEAGCVWRLLVTCRAEEWERVQVEFLRQFGTAMDWEIVRLASPSFEQLHPVWGTFPLLRDLAVRPHLRDFMCNIKVIDILASAIRIADDIPDRSWTGESDIIKWYWEIIVRKGKYGASRSALLQRIAETEADSGRFELAETELTSNELNLISELRDILVQDKRSTVSFTHDLFADWSRLQGIISHESMLREYLQGRLTNPHWHTAIRLYGIALLERDNTGKSWERIINEIPDIRNSLLESLVFAGNPLHLLEVAWPILIENDGQLLVDLLNRFLYVATIPNPQYLELAKVVDATDVEASTWERFPLWMYWLGMLRFLVSKSDDVVHLAYMEIAQISYTWLRYVPLDWPGREDASTLALASARHTFRVHRCIYYHNYTDKAKQLPWKAVLEAFLDKPEKVAELALKACARIAPEKDDGEAYEDYYLTGTITARHPLADANEDSFKDTWPLGPLYRADAAFRSACFSTDSLRVMMEKQPELASEIILSLLLKVKNPNYFGGDSFGPIFQHKALMLEDDSSFYPRFYTQGPFLLFLRVNPKFALNTIIQVVDFATERWIEKIYKEDIAVIGIEIHLETRTKTFMGDYQVFDWYHAIAGSDLITSALMAIEKWLYQLIDNGESVEKWVSYILEESQSLAFLGLLTEIGRYRPSLFTRPLRFILLNPVFYYFEQLYIIQGGHSFGTPFFDQGELFWNLTREWDTMEHRKLRLMNIAVDLYRANEKFRTELLTTRKRIEESLHSKNNEFKDFSDNLFSVFDALIKPLRKMNEPSF